MGEALYDAVLHAAVDGEGAARTQLVRALHHGEGEGEGTPHAAAHPRGAGQGEGEALCCGGGGREEGAGGISPTHHRTPQQGATSDKGDAGGDDRKSNGTARATMAPEPTHGGDEEGVAPAHHSPRAAPVGARVGFVSVFVGSFRPFIVVCFRFYSSLWKPATGPFDQGRNKATLSKHHTIMTRSTNLCYLQCTDGSCPFTLV